MSEPAAISNAVEVARQLGLAIEEPVSLRSTNNVVVWLRPANVVAKVSNRVDSRLLTELQVAQELSALGAPVVSPAAEVPAIVHRRGELEMTFWRYHAQPESAEIAPDRVALALRELHASLGCLSAALKASLPAYMAELKYVRSLLADPAALPAAEPADRDLLITAFDRLQAALDERAPADRFVVLHGSPHSYNRLLVDDDPVFIDFETACLGPVEWDLAHLQSPVAINTELLRLCQGMVSVKTATLCMAEIDRGDLREHAEYHLEHVREDVLNSIGD